MWACWTEPYEGPLLPPSRPSRPPSSLLTWTMHHLPGRIFEEVHHGGIGPSGLCLGLGGVEEGVKEEKLEEGKEDEAWLQQHSGLQRSLCRGTSTGGKAALYR